MSRRGKAEAEPAENHERWIVTYADMVTLLFAVFVVLWALSEVDETKFEKVRTSLEAAFDPGVLGGSSGSSPIFEGSDGIAPSLKSSKAEALDLIRNRVASVESGQGGAAARIQLRSDETSITISRADNLLFDSGSAQLKAGSDDVLLEIASALRELPNRIRIEGHTDPVLPSGSEFRDNWELSAARAQTVLLFLIDEGNVPGAQLEAAFFADTVPIAPNDTPEGRALNRRADIVVLFEETTFVDPAAVPDLEAEAAAQAEATAQSEQE